MSEVSDSFLLPVGRIINHSCFVKTKYDDKSVAQYTIEIAIPEDDPGLDNLEDQIRDFADEKWGEGAGDDDDLVLPLLEGNKLKRKREKKGKQGDAYENTTVIRANTIYNYEGEEGPGGIEVYDEDKNQILLAEKSRLYLGCMVRVAVVMHGYETNNGDNAVKFYLQAVQKVGDGEKLRSSSDRSGLFSPVKRSEKEKRAGRRARRSREDDDEAPREQKRRKPFRRSR